MGVTESTLTCTPRVTLGQMVLFLSPLTVQYWASVAESRGVPRSASSIRFISAEYCHEFSSRSPLSSTSIRPTTCRWFPVRVRGNSW